MQGAEQLPHKKSHPAGQKLQKMDFVLFCFRKSIKTSRSAAKAINLPPTRAVLGQVLVFALLFLPKRAAGMAALSGLAFTGCPPVWKENTLGLEMRVASSQRDEEEEVLTIPGALGRGSGQQNQQRYSPLCPATSWDPAC